MNYFDVLSYAHKSMVGYIILKSDGPRETEGRGTTPKEVLQVMANSIKASCYPESSHTVDVEINPHISEMINKNGKKGININYITQKNGEVSVWFNDNEYTLPGSE